MATQQPLGKRDRSIQIGDQITAKIVEVAQQASEADQQSVRDLSAKSIAQADNPVTEMVAVTPGMGALFFTGYNKFNRPWDPSVTYEYARIMSEGGWRQNSQGYALYGDDGSLGDGSHRTGAQAYSGTTLIVPMYLGMSKEAVATLDCGKKRTAADAAALAGVINARAKQTLLGSIWAYEKAAGFPNPTSAANTVAFAEKIKELDGLLTRALELGQVSIDGVVEPLFVNEQTAAKVIGLLLRHRWPEQRVTERMDQLQSKDFASDKAPLAIARDYIEKHRKPVDTKTPAQEVAMVIKAMVMSETRATVTGKHVSEITNAAKHPASPEYPAQTFSEAAD